MGPSGISPRIVRFGAFEVDLANAELRKGGLRLRVQEQPFQVLAALLEQPGEVISREALIARLWPDGTVVDFDRGLNAAITRLRQTLSDSPETPRYIETVARRGYRFIAPLGGVGEPAGTSRAEPVSTTPRRRVWVWPALALALLLIGSAMISRWVFRTREAPARPLSASPVTSQPGDELCPSFSPDGTRIAYEWDEGHGDSHIFIKLVGAGDPLRLTSGAAHEFGPAWSPDGSQIAFIRRLDEGTLGVILKPAISGVERPLTEFAAPVDWWPQEPGYRWLAWTPDAKHLIVSGAQDASAPLALYVVSVEGADRRRLTTPPSVQTWDRSPAVSPDGRTVAFSRGLNFGDSGLYLLTLSDDLRPIGDARRVTTDNHSVHSLAWTADGREIVFSDNRGLWRIESDTNGASRQPVWVGEGGFPAITKGGRLIYARSFADSNIWRQELPRDGETVPPASPLITSTAADFNPQYSPDGTQIALQSRRSGYSEIWLCASDGAQCGPLTSFHGAPAGTPRWSPNGKQIAFDCYTAAGNWDVYVMDANGGSRQPLTTDPATDSIPSWSQDGKSIYFTSNRTGRFEVWRVSSQGGAADRVTHNGGFAAFESPGGEALYYTKGDLGLKLWRSALDGSGERVIVDAVAERGFVVGADRIYYLRPEPGGGRTLRCLILSTGKGSLVSSPLKRLVLGLSVSPDGKYAIYSQVDHEGSDLMLVEDFLTDSSGEAKR